MCCAHAHKASIEKRCSMRFPSQSRSLALIAPTEVCSHVRRRWTSLRVTLVRCLTVDGVLVWSSYCKQTALSAGVFTNLAVSYSCSRQLAAPRLRSPIDTCYSRQALIFVDTCACLAFFNNKLFQPASSQSYTHHALHTRTTLAHAFLHLGHIWADRIGKSSNDAQRGLPSEHLW